IRADVPTRPLREMVEQVRRPVEVRFDEWYSLLGMRLSGGGLFLRETKLGSDIRARSLNKVEEGDFVYSRLFAWRGAFGVAEQSHDGCHVSNEFPLFRVDQDQIDLSYLWSLFRDQSMWERVREQSSGGTPLSRNRLR